MRPDGPPIARYEHASTRRHVNLDEHGSACRYVHAQERAAGGTSARVPLEPPIERAFAGSERMCRIDASDPRWTPDHDTCRRWRKDVPRRAGLSVVEP